MSFTGAGYIDRVLGLLQKVRPKGGGGWTAACAAHDDRNNSLSIDAGDGRILLKCFAGCDTAAIVSALGLQLADLYEPRAEASAPSSNGRVTVAKLAEVKGLSIEFLTARGVKDFSGGVLIPYHHPDGTETARPRIRTALVARDGSKWKVGKDDLVPLGLNDLDDARRLHALCIAEGETDYWTLRTAAFPALGIPSAEMVKVLKQEHVKDINRVYVTIDADPAGEKFFANVRERVTSFGIADVYTVRMPAGVKDVNDLYRRDPAGFRKTFTALLKDGREASRSPQPIPPASPTTPVSLQTQEDEVPQSELDVSRPERADDGDTTEGQGKRESAATALVRLVQESNVELFHTASREAYISIPANGHCETYPLKSKAVRDWLSRLFWEHLGKTPNGNAVQDARQTLAGMACFDGPEHEVFLRVARGSKGIYLDLGDESWSAVEITAEGWSVVPNPPIRFRRPAGMLPLPTPRHGGNLQLLRRYVNLASDEDFILATSWQIGALRPATESGGAYAVLNVTGEQGSAKSTAAKILRQSIDPVDAPLRAAPREERDLMIAALNGHVVSFDNVSRLPDAMSDVLCRLASGTALSTRQLYSDDEEAILKAHRPIILNGITEVVTRGDLLDRALSITLPTIPDEKRQLEAQVWDGFRRDHALILGALLDAVSMAMSREGKVAVERPPRLADFAMWIACAEPACPWPEGAFLTAYRGSQEAAIEGSLEGNPVADVVRRLPPSWSGTSAELLAKMNDGASETARRQPDWPKTPRALSGELRRRATSLRKVGIDIHFPDGKSHKNGRILAITRIPPEGDGGDGRAESAGSTVPLKTSEIAPNLTNGDGGDGGDGRKPTNSPLSSEPQGDGHDGFDF